MVELKLFYLFYSFIYFCSISVVFLGNPVHSVLALVLVFVFGSSLLILVGLEFLSMTLIIVYVGAIAMLFLFIMMMLKIKVFEFFDNKMIYLPFSLFFLLFFLFEFLFIFYYFKKPFMNFFKIIDFNFIFFMDWGSNLDICYNSLLLGEILFSYYIVIFLFLGFILLCAMVGAIGLTFDISGWYLSKSKKQDVFMQVKVKTKVLSYIE